MPFTSVTGYNKGPIGAHCTLPECWFPASSPQKLVRVFFRLAGRAGADGQRGWSQPVVERVSAIAVSPSRFRKREQICTSDARV